MNTLTIRTSDRCQLIDITELIRETVHKKRIMDGICQIFAPHTTAAVKINENADPDVSRDIISILDRLIPCDGPYLHREGNSAAHLKASLIGSSVTVMIENGCLVLGTWQGIYFCEFDGPRSRKIHIKSLAGK
jgi:secondary thiamine-phosphate synthase enzyme